MNNTSRNEMNCLKGNMRKSMNLQADMRWNTPPCGIGDIIEDSVGRIIVEKIKVEFGQYDGARRMPTCIYYGTELRKADNRPKSKGEKRGITQNSRLLKIVVKAEDSKKEENNGNVM